MPLAAIVRERIREVRRIERGRASPAVGGTSQRGSACGRRSPVAGAPVGCEWGRCGPARVTGGRKEKTGWRRSSKNGGVTGRPQGMFGLSAIQIITLCFVVSEDTQIVFRHTDRGRDCTNRSLCAAILLEFFPDPDHFFYICFHQGDRRGRHACYVVCINHDRSVVTQR